MIDHDRLIALRDRYAEMRADYARAGDDVRAANTALQQERAARVLAVASGIAAASRKRNPNVKTATADQIARDPDVQALVDSDPAEAGLKPAQVAALRAREAAVLRKRQAHQQLGERLRVWSQYMAGVEALAREHNA